MSRANRAIRGTIWNTGASYFTMLVSFVGNLVLARLLFPEDFGTYALATAMLTIIFIFAGFGSQEAIIQCRDPNIKKLIPTAFWITISLGIALSIIGTLLGAFLIETQDQLVGELVMILSWVRFVSMIGNAYQATLIRDLSFRPIAYQLFFPTLISFTVAVILAINKFGIWSLLVRELLDSVLRFTMAMRASRFRLKLEFNRAASRWIWDFGWRSMFSRAGEIIFERWDKLVIGTQMGTATLGHYNLAYRLAITGSQLTQQPIATISHSTYASVQSEITNLRLALERATYWLFRSGILLALFVWFAGAELTILFYGAKWSLAANIFKNMFVFVSLLPLINNLKYFLIGSGNIQRNLISQAAQIFTFFPLLIIAVNRENLIAVSWSLNVSSMVTLGTMIYFVHRIVAINWNYIFVRPLWVGVITATLAFVAKEFLDRLLLADWLSLLLMIGLIGSTYLVLTITIDGQAFRNELRIIRSHLT